MTDNHSPTEVKERYIGEGSLSTVIVCTFGSSFISQPIVLSQLENIRLVPLL